MRVTRLAASAAALAIIAAGTLMGASAAQATGSGGAITDNLNGSATLEWTDLSPLYVGFYFCDSTVPIAECDILHDANIIGVIGNGTTPALTPSPTTVWAGTTIKIIGGAPIVLQPGLYTITYWEDGGENIFASATGVRLDFAPGNDAPPIPPWVQGYGRASAQAACDDGWLASWEQWPHGGSGGWVCTRSIPSLG
jgi:hypothetical protein